jgi:hypothetical protein
VRIDGSWRIVIDADRSSTLWTAALDLREELRQVGARVRAVDGVSPSMVGAPLILLTAQPLQAAALTGNPIAGFQPPARPEAYCIRVTSNAVVVVGSDERGAFYGAQTLLQLVGSGGNGYATLPAVRVDDYPTLAFRGAHLFVGPRGLPFHEKLIDRVFARCKMNNVVFECEQAQWRSTRGAWTSIAMPLPALREDVDFAKAHAMTATPLIESAGHMKWLLATKRFSSLAEDPAPRSWSPVRRAICSHKARVQLAGFRGLGIGLDARPTRRLKARL